MFICRSSRFIVAKFYTGRDADGLLAAAQCRQPYGWSSERRVLYSDDERTHWALLHPCSAVWVLGTDYKKSVLVCASCKVTFYVSYATEPRCIRTCVRQEVSGLLIRRSELVDFSIQVSVHYSHANRPHTVLATCSECQEYKTAA